MIRLTFCLRRLPHLSREEFQRYWRDQHGPLVAALAPALGIRRYVQLHTRTTPLDQALRAPRGAPEEYDGVAELWWDSIEALRAAAATPEGRAAGRQLLEDERRFIDLARSPVWLGEEQVLVGGWRRFKLAGTRRFGMPLMRSRDQKIIAGVCGGLAAWLGWDPTIVRILYVLGSIASAAFPGVLVYLLLWIVMPKAPAASS